MTAKTTTMVQAHDADTEIKLSLIQLPILRWQPIRSKSYQMGQYMRQLIKQHLRASCRKLILPSPAEIAGFFGCAVVDVLDACQELLLIGYNYDTQGLHRPLVLYVNHPVLKQAEPNTPMPVQSSTPTPRVPSRIIPGWLHMALSPKPLVEGV